MRIRRIGIALVTAIVAVAAISFGISIAYALSPEQAVQRYVEQAMRGDEGGALGAWAPAQPPGQAARIDALNKRRDMVTRELAIARPTTYRLRGIEWWRTCCEPGLADKPEHAGLARVWVELTLPDGPHDYFFDVRHEPSCCANDPFEALQLRYWVLRDVYPTTKLPLHLPWVYDAARRDSHGVGGVAEP